MNDTIKKVQQGLNGVKTFIKGLRPRLMTQRMLAQIRKEAAVDGAVSERRWWDSYKNGQLFGGKPNNGGPFTEFDDFYLNFHGAPGTELNFSGVLEEDSVAKKVLTGVKNITEALTGGYVTITGLKEAAQDGAPPRMGIGTLSRTQSRSVLCAFQDAAWIKATMDPRGVAITSNIQYYTIGQGLKVDTPSPEVNEVILAFRKLNRMQLRESSIVKEAFIEGEYAFLIFINKDNGDVRIRKIPSKEITSIETHPEDIETRLSYTRNKDDMFSGDDSYTLKGSETGESVKYYADIDYFKQLEDGFDPQSSKYAKNLNESKLVLFLKYGFVDELRGRVPMASILRYLKYYEDFVIDRIRLHHERAKVVWIKTITGSGRALDPATQSNPLLSPRGGTIWIETQNERYRIENPRLDSGNAKEDGLHILYSICAGVTMPLHILEQRADEANYSSIRKADTPFSQMILGNQNFLDYYFERLYRLAVTEKVKAGELPETIKVIKVDEGALESIMRKINEMVVEGVPIQEIIEAAEPEIKKAEHTVTIKTVDIDINIVFPAVVQEDPLDQAKVLLIHDRLGIVSKRTMSGIAGYDWREELILLKEEAMIKPPTQRNIRGISLSEL